MDEREAPLPVHAKEILEHYLANRITADTLEGIAEWLLLEDLVQRRVESTGAALQWLVSQGLFERVTLSAATPPLYRLNADKVDDAVRLLEASRQR